MRTYPCLAVICAVVLGILPSGRSQPVPLSTAFTYQGRLVAGGAPANGRHDLLLSLYDREEEGTLLAPIATNNMVAVSNGLFSTTVDFGPGVFSGSMSWLEVALRPSGSGLPYSRLLPRQPITATPYALYAPNAGMAEGAAWSGLVGIPPGFSDGVDQDTTYSAGDGLLLDGTKFGVVFGGNGVATTIARSDHGHAASDINDGAGSGLDADLLDGLDSARFWKLTGNASTVTGTDYLGTSDNLPLEFRVNNQRALRLIPTASTPNLVAGASNNIVEAGFVGGTILGGTDNSVVSDYATIPGGHGAQTRMYGQTARANGTFAGLGDAQASTYILRRTTTAGGQAEMFLDGAGARMVVPRGGHWTFFIQVIAADSSGVTAGFEASGVIKNYLGATALVEPVFPAILARERSAWNVSVSADNTRDALVLTVTGEAGRIIRWVATVRTVEVVF